MVLDGYVRIAKHAGLRQAEAVLDGLSALAGDPHEIADTLRYHHLIRLVRALAPESALRARLPAGLVAVLETRRPVQRVPVATLLHAFEEVRHELEAAGVPVLLLKGFYYADRLYGGLERRPQHDIDVLVRRRDFRRALRRLRRLGFSRRAYDLHSRSYRRGDVQIDVHFSLRWAPAFALDEQVMWDTACEVRIGGRTTRSLSDDYTLVCLALASFEDLGQGMGKLKQLLDLYLFLREVDGTMDWEAFFVRRTRENLLAITVNVLGLVTELFEAREDIPRLSAAVEQRRGLCILAGRDEVLDLVSAPRKHPPNLVWFGRIYPGSLIHYLAWFWYGGFPANIRRFGTAWLRSHLRLAVMNRPGFPGGSAVP